MADRHSFFASCALGAESVLTQEIETFRALTIGRDGLPSTGVFRCHDPVKGGVEFEAELEVGLALNFWLKTANRILMRLSVFEAKSPPRLFDRLKKVDLRPFGDSPRLHFVVESRKCRVNNEKQIRRFASDLWELDDQSDLTLYLRGENDHWTLSVDTSGTHLHKRGARKQSGAAPLRETLAAFTLRLLTETQPRLRRQQTVLLDPMAGTGTFLREAWELDQPVRTRPFAFQKWRQLPKILSSESYWKNLAAEWQTGESWSQLVAGEIDPSVFKLLETSLKQLEPRPKLHLLQGDSWSRKGREKWGIEAKSPLWVVTNPPYGERLGGLEWVQKLPLFCEEMQADLLALWIPEELVSTFLKRMGRAPDQELRMSNGGLPCRILIFHFVKP